MEGCSVLQDSFFKKAVGKCPYVCVMINGLNVRALIDTGSQVSIMSAGTHRRLKASQAKRLPVNLKITAANGLEVPYDGFCEADVEVWGQLVRSKAFLIRKEACDSRESPDLIIGMNVLAQLTEFKRCPNLLGTAKISGREPVHVQSGAAVAVRVCGLRQVDMMFSHILIEPLPDPPRGLVVMPTFSTVLGKDMYVQVLNITKEDIVLRPPTRKRDIPRSAD